MKIKLQKFDRETNQRPTDFDSNCLICGEQLIYSVQGKQKTCAVCGQQFVSNASCKAGHFVCDKCHSSDAMEILIPFLTEAKEKSPQRLLESVMALRGVHVNGPEHHVIVPCVLLTAYKNCGGDIDLKKALDTAASRGEQVPGGTCGNWGACGASVGAGIYVSIVTGATPLKEKVWHLPQMLVAECLEKNAEIGGPRCCKRTARTAISAAVRFTEKNFGISMEDKTEPCKYSDRNKQCIGTRCPYFGGESQR